MKIKANTLQQFMVVIIVIYAMLYEWRSICELDSFLPWVNAMKAVVPLLLLIFLLKSRAVVIKHRPCRNYLFFFVLFMCWGFCSSILSIVPQECMVQWLKFLFLLGFCYLICEYLLTFEAAQDRLMKIFIAVAIFTVAQYILLEIVTFSGSLQRFNLPTHRGGMYCGPFGILGQGSGNVYFKSMGFSLYRIYGFWLEPSTAAGFLLASAFFAEALFIKTKQAVWRILGIVSFCGGIFTFSNSAYVAIGAAGLLAEAVFLKDKNSQKLLRSIAVIFYVFLIIYAVFGRAIVAKYFPNNIDMRYVVGVRDSVKDPYGGRVELLASNFNFANFDNISSSKSGWGLAVAVIKNTFMIVKDTLLGVGFRIPGCDEQGRGFSVFPGALVFWFVFTGAIGLIFLVLRELQVALQVMNNVFLSRYVLRISQAWLSIAIVNMSYGTLMSPFYFITVALVFSSVYHLKIRGNIE